MKRPTRLTLTLLATLSLSLSLIGCVTDGAPPPSTYRTLDPIASGALADLVELNRLTATPPPSVPNLPTPPLGQSQAGTPYADYLDFAITGGDRQIELLGQIGDGNFKAARKGIDLTNEQIGWLAGHEPQPCYQKLYEQHQVMLDAVLAAYRAVDNLKLDSPDKLAAATDEVSQMTSMFDSVECI